MIQRFRIFLGPANFRLLITLLILTGGFNIVLLFVDTEWTTNAQTAIALFFVAAALVIIGRRMNNEQRLRWLAIMAPAIGLLVLGMIFFPDTLPLLLGGALGWIVAGIFIFGSSRGPMEYKTAVRHLRRSEYKEAVDAMDRLIKAEPDQPNHYRFRAELLRLWGKLGRARRSYEDMLRHASEPAVQAVAYNGLAEVDLQAGDYASARVNARLAYDLAPDEWVAAYNLGMIDDRLRDSSAVVANLSQVIQHKIPDERHRLLIHFYLLRAHCRLGDQEAAASALDAMRQQRGGYKEWQSILASEQADTLREVLAADMALVGELLSGERSLADLIEAEAT